MVDGELLVLVLEDSMLVVSLVGDAGSTVFPELAGVLVLLGLPGVLLLLLLLAVGVAVEESPVKVKVHTATSNSGFCGSSLNLAQLRHLVQMASLAMLEKKERVGGKAIAFVIRTVG